MDATKEWPDNVLTTKEHITSLYPPFHTLFEMHEYMADDFTGCHTEQGTILHHLAFSSLSNEMIRWMIQYYRACLVVYDDEGRAPLHVAVEYDNVLLVRLFLEAVPSLIDVNDKDGDCVFYYVPVSTTNPNNVRNELLHLLLDYTNERVPAELLISDGTDVGDAYTSWLRSVLLARYRCKLVATILEKRRLINGNKDTSWLVAQFIWATRTNEAWTFKYFA